MGKILVVDDDPDILKIADRILAHAGHEVKVAENALSALDLLTQTEFDLLISDANMPRYSGFELVQTIRANPRYQKLTIAMLTGLRERKDVEKAVKIGADDYIIKPLDPLLLVQKVAALLQKHQPEQKPEIKLNPEATQSIGYMTISVQLESISELGVVIRTSQQLHAGQTVDLTANFSAQLGDKFPPLKVLNVRTLSEKPLVYRAELAFLGANEALLQKIRRYIFSHGATNRAAS